METNNKTIICKTKNNQKLMLDCIENKVFTKDGLLGQTIRHQFNEPDSCKIVVAYEVYNNNSNKVNENIKNGKSKSIKKHKAIGVILELNNTIQIFIKPKYRGYKLGNKLMETLIKKHKVDAEKLIAWAPLNKAGEAFYKKHGIAYKGTGIAFYEALGWTVVIPDKKERLTEIKPDYKTRKLKFS